MPEKQKVGKMSVEAKKGNDFEIVVVDGVFGGIDPNFAHLFFFQEDPEISLDSSGNFTINKIQKRILFEMRMSPSVFFALHEWMNKSADHYKEIMQKISEEQKSRDKEEVGI